MKTVVTGAFGDFREATRHLWNLSVASKRRAGIQDVLDFSEIEKMLFAFMVLRPFGLEKLGILYSVNAIKQLTVQPRTPRTRIEGYKRRQDEVGNYYWDQQVSMKDQFESIRFIDFFDWDCYGLRDYALIRCELSGNADLRDGSIVMMEFSDIDVVLTADKTTS